MERKYGWKRMIYIPDADRTLVEEVAKMVETHGQSLSNLVIQLLREYHRVHAPGNPQLTLDRSSEAREAPPNWCFSCREVLCQECLEAHRKSRPSHKLGFMRLKHGGFCAMCKVKLGSVDLRG